MSGGGALLGGLGAGGGHGSADVIGQLLADPSDGKEMTYETVSPGLPGFIAMFAIALVTVLLVLDMSRRIRRIQARARVEARMQAEAEESARAAGEPDGAERGQTESGEAEHSETEPGQTDAGADASGDEPGPDEDERDRSDRD